MATIIEIAKKEVGTKETPANTNKTKYGVWFGLNGVAWCGIFVSWVYSKAGTPLKKLGFLKGFAGCQSAVAAFKKTGEITKDPVPGDIVFFDFNQDGRYDHTGIFVKWDNVQKTIFTSIEGNTSIQNDANGGEVMVRTRKASIAIFVHPVVSIR